MVFLFGCPWSLTFEPIYNSLHLALFLCKAKAPPIDIGGAERPRLMMLERLAPASAGCGDQTWPTASLAVRTPGGAVRSVCNMHH